MTAPLAEVEALTIGASAGAVEALSAILPALPADSAFPVVVVVHLPPRQKSMLVELFRDRCAVPVGEPVDKAKVDRGIWFAPPDYHLLIEMDRTFSLSVNEPVNYSRPSIDVLFRSAADVYGAHLVAIVLTGSNTDGALGARAVRDAGGFVVVQDPALAEATMMPSAACESAQPQMIGSLEAIAAFVRGLTASEASS